MKKYEHIKQMEDILRKQEQTIANLNVCIDEMHDNMEEYNRLIEYYYSEQRDKDLADDEKGLIPQDLKRGVLSEDEIYNLMVDYQDVVVKLLDLARDILG